MGPSSLPNLRDGQFLGRGSEKRVEATTRNGELVALLSSPSVDLIEEAQLMMRLNQRPHPHLLPLLAVESVASNARDDAPSVPSVSIVAPIARFGSMLDLTDHLEFEGATLTRAHVDVAMEQVLRAVNHLGSLGLDHGDLHVRNVLVFDFDTSDPASTQIKLSDFGHTREGCPSPVDLERLEKEMCSLLPPSQT